MTFRCAILDDYQNVALQFADWSPLKDKIDITVFNTPFASSADVVTTLQDFPLVCVMRERTPFSRDMLKALPNLKLLITTGTRNASIDLVAAKELGITVCHTGAYGNPTVGVAIGLMLELTRKIGFENARMHAGEKWQTTIGWDLEGRTLGVVGLGKLGRKVATVAKALDMKVIAWSSNLTKEACAEAGVGYATKEELFSTADMISIHLVLSDRSRGIVSAADIARMKKTAYLVNTARGPLVDEAALLDALQNKKIAGAGLDTYSVEPLPLDSPLRKLDNVVLTPHLGYVTDGAYNRFFNDMVEDITAWLKGAPVRVMT